MINEVDLAEHCLLLPEKIINGERRKFPALAGITKSVVGNFSSDQTPPLNEFTLCQRLSAAAGTGPDFHKLMPLHRDGIHLLLKENSDHWAEGDGFITFLKDFPQKKKIGPALISTTADCPTVVITEASQRLIGILHCGWRGLEMKIIAKAILLIKAELHLKCNQIFIGIFPGICKNCYRVGIELTNKFRVGYEKGRLDLRAVILDQITNYNVDADRIFIADYCSFHSKIKDQAEFFSHRRGRDEQMECRERNAVFIARRKV